MRRFRNLGLHEIRQMPIYEYRCDNCNHEFETIQKVSDAPLTKCPACAEDALRKKVSAAGFRLKGGGWYETDFKAGKKKNVAGDEAGKKNGGTEGASASGSESSSGSTKESSKSTDTPAKGGTSKASAPE